MSKEEKAQEEILDDADLEKSFNESLEDLKKSLGDEEEQEEEDLEKAKKNPPKKSDAEPEDEEEAEEEEEEEGYEEKVKKSIEDQLGEDPEAEAAMDVEPFLRSLVKSIDEAIQNVRKEIIGKIAEAECLLKSQGKLLVAQAKLQKSVQEKVDKVANTPIPSNSLRALQKSRFEAGEKNIELSGVEILEKSRNWIREGKIDLVEAGIIESRVNKGTIGKVDDVTDKKVKNLLMKEVG
jgi:hypothetical protein